MEETKKMLEKQLQLLSEQTAQAKGSEETARLSQAMCEVSDALNRTEAMRKDALKQTHRTMLLQRYNVEAEVDRVVDKKFRGLWITQVLLGLAIIVHVLFGH